VSRAVIKAKTVLQLGPDLARRRVQAFYFARCAMRCSVPGVDRLVSGFVERDHVVSLLGVALHARRTERHPRHGESGYLRSLAEQAVDIPRRHMPLDHIAFDQRGMTGSKLGGNAMASFVRSDVGYLAGLHIEPVGAQVIDPLAAAAAGRALVNDNFRGARDR